MAWVVLSGLLCLGAIAVTMVSAGGASALDWQPAFGLREPWRLWTCAWVHGSLAHLLVNVAGGAVVAFVGWRARLPPAAAAAWFVAWPGTQVLMAAIGSERLAAAMPHYFGLSGVLHAGVVVLGLSLAWPPVRARSHAAPREDAAFVATRASAIEPSRITDGPWAMTELGASTALPVSTLDAPPTPPADAPPLGERWIGVAILAGTLAKGVSEAPWDLAPRASEALGIAVAPIAHACGIVAGLLAWAVLRLLDRRAR
ncbi:hypothetical protein [Scleromatobacter humisilvae]|uniref:Peptidase S54 rhomboid domain-containing protein n=1 Tax=Scleromatobacter humisilvae TaxID=2897159 RepID=A0A9X2C342_9BURK|nr:hypothetical protein [Scleromatobacter humisilvae]MCK9689596.1 hypothetical protein [Scleromatobacter humisilvae]